MKKTMKDRLIRCVFVFFLTLTIIWASGWVADYRSSISDSEETVRLVSEHILIPGGQSVGIRMNVRGVLVVGLEEIETEYGIVSPGYLGGLQIGDTVISINGTPVYYAEDVARIINGSKQDAELCVQRKDEELKLKVKPVKSLEDGDYKLGVWVKEKIAGIGTLTFYDPQSDMYAALGHGIYENKTGTLLEADNGQLLRTEVKAIREGTAGKPGEIRGIFYSDDEAMGSVRLNSQYGVYSKGLKQNLVDEIKPVVMATQEQIKEGPAQILTTINGSKVETFDITIDKVNLQKEAGSKGIELSVVDEKLLSYSGGIVQGMSGSPIIQNGRLVGAVTHVFVNNPTKGYGIFAQWMVEEAYLAKNLS